MTQAVPAGIAVVALALAAVAPAAARPRCPGGAFVVHAGPRLVAGIGGTYDVLQVGFEGGRPWVAVAGACRPARARIRGARLVATWPAGRCGARRLTLTARMSADCELLRARARPGRGPALALVAARCGADGVVDAAAGEQCAGPGDCAAGAACVDCRCVPAVRFARDVRPLLQSCRTLACHEGPRPTGRFDLSPARAHAALLDGIAGAPPCAGERLVVPGDPDRSVLVARVSGDTCGLRMPPASPLTPAEVDTVRAWVAQGARDD